jgi:hypothetical protein
MYRKNILLVLAAALILSGCNLPGAAKPTATIDIAGISTTIVETAVAQLSATAETAATPTVSPTPSLTPLPPTLPPAATVEVQLNPVDGISTYAATVRSWPGKGGDDLGFVRYNVGVKVLARNNIGNWLYIIWADSPTGKGWVLAQAFDLKVEIGRLPIALEDGKDIVFAPPIIWDITGTPLPLPTLSNDPALRPATITAGVSVRVCPSKGCLVIGRLNTGDQISMTGRFGKNEWAQIEFPSGPNGKGWVSHDAILPGVESFGGLPYFDIFGVLITPEPDTATPDPNLSPTPTITPTSTPAGPLAEITDVTTVYTLMSSLSPIVGTLAPKTKIHITAQSINSLWFEIQYPADTTGRAYISSKSVKLLGDFRYLPYTDVQGTPLPTPK